MKIEFNTKEVLPYSNPAELLRAQTELREGLIRLNPLISVRSQSSGKIFSLTFSGDITFPPGTREFDVENLRRRIHLEFSELIHPWIVASREESVKLVNQI